MTTKLKKKINGVILLDKPEGLSSNQAIRKLAWILNADKVGHTGTLDPMATGLLPICLGEATKFSSFLLDGDKEYLATMQLGLVTDSGDKEGNVIANNPVTTNLQAIKEALSLFKGEISQTPPMYSALKYQGRPLYEYARSGISIERKSRKVNIYDIELISYCSRLEQVTFRALVSKGTYIRTLAEDIGNSLGYGASLVSLRRTKANHFNLSDCLTLEEIANSGEDDILDHILAVDFLVSDLPKYEHSSLQFEVIRYGNLLTIPQNPFPESENFRLYANGLFLGIASFYQKNQVNYIKPKRLLSGLADLQPW